MVSRVLVDDFAVPSLSVDRVQVRRITIPPHGATGVHRHNGPVVGVIERGTAIVQIGDGPVVEVHAGETFYEPAETRIRRFDAGEEELVFLAWFPIGDGVEPQLIPLDD